MATSITPAFVARGVRFAVALALPVLLFSLGGCLEVASERDFNFDNPNDTTPPPSDDDDAGGISIFLVDAFDDVIVIVNQSISEQAMDLWRLANEDQSESYEFASFTLSSGGAVRVHSDDGTDSDSDLFTGIADAIDWGNGLPNLTAILFNSADSPVSNCEENDPCWP